VHLECIQQNYFSRLLRLKRHYRDIINNMVLLIPRLIR